MQRNVTHFYEQSDLLAQPVQYFYICCILTPEVGRLRYIWTSYFGAI